MNIFAVGIHWFPEPVVFVGFELAQID